MQVFKGDSAAREELTERDLKDPTQLPYIDKLDLEFFEGVIEKGLKTFLEVGSALISIKERQLYLGQYTTFQEYCKKRWKFTKQRAYQLISAAELSFELAESTTVDPRGPVCESQARPLVPLDLEQRRKAWKLSVEKARGQQPTARIVADAAREIQGLPPRPRDTMSIDRKTIEKPEELREFENALMPLIRLAQKFEREEGLKPRKWHDKEHVCGFDVIASRWSREAQQLCHNMLCQYGALVQGWKEGLQFLIDRNEDEE
jgi:hypothetical protein